MPSRLPTSLRSAARTCALALALCPALASAAAPACLSRAEARSVLTYSLPQVIDGTAKRCRQALPANAYLTTHGQEIVQRYSGQRETYWPQARSAFLKLSNSRDQNMGAIAAQLPDETLKPLVDATVSGLVAQSIHLESCEEIDLAINLLAPLPPQNTAGLIALFIEVAAHSDLASGRGGQQPSTLRGLSICKD
ncbi:hypothetical protein HT136_21930 [Novosphingobium profundi]|uniref:hypothetical protein n=1 Tax=Novosphingobium profundi TaxID=1774954 RepID=UPI001BD987DE|nr:hypothetical protein [Novosphingobium profundi]MBT0671036.1 hypothetical protein [Novosphingobium profundi]